jgi:hypothetical protein
MKKYAEHFSYGGGYTIMERDLYRDLQATVQALEVAKEKLSFYADHKKSMFDTGGQAKIGLKKIEQILGAKP